MATQPLGVVRAAAVLFVAFGATLVGGGGALLTLGGCAGDASASADPVKSAERLRGRWELVALGDERIEANTQKGERQPDLTVTDDNTARGHAGVNSYTGTLDAAALARGEFRAGALITTKRAGTPGLMDLERRMLEALSGADGYAISGSRLTLLKGDVALAIFRKR